MARTGRAAHPAAHDSTPLVARVFAALCDGRFHSGEQLARSLGVSRSAIWKATGTLRELGATLHAVRNRGYCLARSEEHTSELQSLAYLVCRLLLEKKKKNNTITRNNTITCITISISLPSLS